MLYKADLHIHTVLSPCGDLDMSPSLIINKAKEKGLDIIGITDHNSTKNAVVCKKIGIENGVFVMLGAEVTSKEEVHCLCFMPDEMTLSVFQKYLDININKKKNKPIFFGNQFVTDENENILGEEEILLIQSINQTIYQISKKVDSLGGIFIPAHIDAHRNSIGSQLGFVPDDLKFNALEMINKTDEKLTRYKVPKDASVISSSDAHYLKDIAKRFTELDLVQVNFENIKDSISLK
jgi:PHP family Zn ribbon phosphoesterase